MCGKHLYHGTQYLITLKNRGKGTAKRGQSIIWNTKVQGRMCLCSHGAGGKPAHELGSIVCQALCSWRCSARAVISLEGSAVLVRTVEAANDSRVGGHTGRPIVDPPASWFCLAKTPDPWDPGVHPLLSLLKIRGTQTMLTLPRSTGTLSRQVS